MHLNVSIHSNFPGIAFCRRTLQEEKVAASRAEEALRQREAHVAAQEARMTPGAQARCRPQMRICGTLASAVRSRIDLAPCSGQRRPLREV